MKLSKTIDNIRFYLTIINGINMLTGNPAKAITFTSAKQAENYKKQLTHPNLQNLQISI